MCAPDDTQKLPDSCRGGCSAKIQKQKQKSFMAAALCLSTCVLCNYYLVSSIFPYSGFMAMQLIDGLTAETSPLYAGMLVSSFMIGRVISSYPWGIVADTYGRRVVLIISLVTGIGLTLLFGFSTSFRMAIITRFVAGFFSGLMVVVKTAITELGRGNHELEQKGMGISTTMGGVGLLISPALGGILSNPLKQYPNQRWFYGVFDNVLAKYPFLLPNLVGSLMCLLCLCFVIFGVEETLSDEKRRDAKYILPDIFNWIRDSCTFVWNCRTGSDLGTCRDTGTENINDTRKEASADIYDAEFFPVSEDQPLLESGPPHRHYTSGVKGQSNLPVAMGNSDGNARPKLKDGTIRSLLSARDTRIYLTAFGLNTFVYVAFNEAFPLWVMNERGGFGWGEKEIGAIATASGLIYSLSQYIVYTLTIKKFGLVKSLKITSRYFLICIFFPIALLLHGWMRDTFIILMMTTITIANSIMFSCATIGTNRTVDASKRGSLNGVSVIVGSTARAGGPIFAGLLVSASMSSLLLPVEYGSLLMYGMFGVVGAAAYASTLLLNDS